jgi:hypothetical protein
MKPNRLKNLIGDNNNNNLIDCEINIQNYLHFCTVVIF